MGGEAIRIHVDGADYVVETPDGASYDGERAQRLLAERIGAGRPLPVQDMRYWLIGVPAPGTPHEETLGDGPAAREPRPSRAGRSATTATKRSARSRCRNGSR